MADSPTVHVVDDDIGVRKSLAFLIAAAGLTVRLYESASSFLEALDDTTQGCLVTDVRMPEIDGLELLRRVKRSGSNLPVIVMTGHADVPLAVQAMKEGAVDFIEKPFDDERLIEAVRASFDRPQSQAKVEEVVRANIASLSVRERQVLDGVLEGRQNKVIAHELGLSPRTVEVYRANVMTKMQAASLPDLIRKVLGLPHL